MCTALQANILLCATYNNPTEELFARAGMFQDFLEAGYKQDYPTCKGTIHPDYRRNLRVLLSQYCKDGLSLKEASGVSTPKELTFGRRIEPSPPAPSSGDGDGDVRPQQQQSPDRAGGCWGGRSGCDANPWRSRRLQRQRGDAPMRHQDAINLLSLVEWFACAHNSG